MTEDQERSIHDEQVAAERERVAATWEQRDNDAKRRPPMTYDEWKRMTFTEGD